MTIRAEGFINAIKGVLSTIILGIIWFLILLVQTLTGAYLLLSNKTATEFWNHISNEFRSIFK